jgi:hypothetical protein
LRARIVAGKSRQRSAHPAPDSRAGKILLARLEQLKDLADLRHLQDRMHEQLGLRVEVAPGFHEVRTMLGIEIQIEALPGLCRKTRKAIPAAIRRGLSNHPEIAFELLNAHDLLRDT